MLTRLPSEITFLIEDANTKEWQEKDVLIRRRSYNSAAQWREISPTIIRATDDCVAGGRSRTTYTTQTAR